MGENTIRIIDINFSDEWDAIVRSFVNYDVYSLSGYVKAFQIHGDGTPVLFYYENDGLRGYNVTMKRDIADEPIFTDQIDHGKWFDLITPYGYGGWVLEGKGDIAILDNAYSNICKELNIVSEFMRYHPMWENAREMEKMYQVVYLGHTIAMNLTDEEVIWNNLTSKNRNMIRKAEKNGVKIFNSLDIDSIQIFKKLYDETMRKDQAESYYFFESQFYESMLKELKNNATVFLAMYGRKTIAAAIMIYANGRLNYHLSGSNINYRTLAPTNLLLYKAALWGYRNGMKTFHLGGGLGSNEDSLYKFKRAFFRGEPKQFAIGKKKFLSDVYDKLNSLRTNMYSDSFFPEYRRPIINGGE